MESAILFLILASPQAHNAGRKLFKSSAISLVVRAAIMTMALKCLRANTCPECGKESAGLFANKESSCATCPQ